MIGGQTVTPSGRRDFAGYDYSTTIAANSSIGLTPGTTYMGSYDANAYMKKIAVVQNTEGAIKLEIWHVKPGYTGPVDYTGTDTTGFLKY